jgi:hypothetical protein
MLAMSRSSPRRRLRREGRAEQIDAVRMRRCSSAEPLRRIAAPMIAFPTHVMSACRVCCCARSRLMSNAHGYRGM